MDIPGNGEFLDSQNNPVFDPYATPIPGSGGFDLEAVGVINSVPVPEPASTLGLFLLGVGGLWKSKVKSQKSKVKSQKSFVLLKEDYE